MGVQAGTLCAFVQGRPTSLREASALQSNAGTPRSALRPQRRSPPPPAADCCPAGCTATRLRRARRVRDAAERGGNRGRQRCLRLPVHAQSSRLFSSNGLSQTNRVTEGRDEGAPCDRCHCCPLLQPSRRLFKDAAPLGSSGTCSLPGGCWGDHR